MDDSIKTRLFSILEKVSEQVTNLEMQDAYGDLIKQMKITSQSESNTDVFRMLNIIRIEYESLQTLYRYEQGKKCP